MARRALGTFCAASLCAVIAGRAVGQEAKPPEPEAPPPSTPTTSAPTTPPPESPKAEAPPPPEAAPAPETKPPEPKADAAKPADTATIPPAVPMIPSDTLGFSGSSPYGPRPIGGVIPRETVALPDRWRIGWPTWDRYGRQAASDPVFQNNTGGDVPYTLGNPLNPHDRNVLKGDYPIYSAGPGEDIFLNVTAVSDTFFSYRKLPTPSGVSATQPGEFDTFGAGEQFFLKETGLLSIDIFQGATAFRPVDWLFRVTPAFDINQLWLRENVVEADVRGGDERGDSHFFLQETFFEMHLGDVSPWFDIMAARIGRQLFVSDFRGFVFNDVSDGIRLFGNAESNRIQWNLAYFNQIDKDTNSEMNTLDWRDQQVLIANLYVQDFLTPGYTAQWSVHWNHDQSDQAYDNNGFLVRPSLVGSVTLQDIDAVYLGWAGDGHFDRLNVNHQFYYVTGRDRMNPIAGRSVDINAFLGEVELSVDIDWLRPKVSFLYASGDSNPTDGTGGGFDGIFDNPTFAGGSGSFFQGNSFRLGGVELKSGKSFYNDVAGAKAQGQSNSVNPGTIVANVGLDAEITPRLRASLNANSLWFADTSSLELILNQNGIGTHLGEEINLTTQYRPLLNNNIILTGGASVFFPGEGFKDIFEDDKPLFQLFVGVTLVY